MTASISLSLALSPMGRLYLYSDPDNQESVSSVMSEKIHSFFDVNDSIGLLRLGLTNLDVTLPPSLLFWRQFAQIFIAEICKQTYFDEQSTAFSQITLPQDEINKWLQAAPFMQGVEHLNQDKIADLWQGLIKALTAELVSFDGKLETYLAAYHAAWNTVGRVCFHLAENKTNAARPFAFLATYTTRLSQSAQAQHVPLGRALEEYAGHNNKSLLLALLLPVQRAAEKSLFLKNLVDTSKIFQPLAWEAKEAHQFLKDIPLFEEAGVMVRVPNWWNPKQPPRPSIKVAIGNQESSVVGMDALLDFDMHFALPSGERLTSQEFKQLLLSQQSLVQIKGQWVQVDNDKLKQVLAHWQMIERQVKKEGLSFAQGLRLLAGVSTGVTDEVAAQDVPAWSTVVEGNYLREILSKLREPDATSETSVQLILQKYLTANLRPYQACGVQWLWWLYTMRLGGCLADDMGLGKTIQILSLLLLVKYQVDKSSAPLPHLLILPASLLGNWQTEIERFAPSLRIAVVHGAALQKTVALTEIDLVMTTYATLQRVPWLSTTHWNMVILDEAQAIKNPGSKQTRAIKQLNARVRFVLTGTPIENRLLDLWSLFDFVAPGLLGSSRVFADYSKQKSKQMHDKGRFYGAIRRLVNPYILRRLKSDKRIINDLPDKTEMQTYCALTKQQAGLYQQAVNELTAKLEQPLDGIKRRGLVLSYLLRFKQICNHPSQWLGHGQYLAEVSGKFQRLKELCEVIAEKREKVLIFTQFREIIPPLHDFLAQLFKQEGLFLHGQTTPKERTKRVEAFQQEQGPPFFVLSLKAGGVGLNLTAAAHVIHFDRWWNPAVENQATDRAYRIGQKRNVLVHKFICRGTIEEKIDKLIGAKKSLSEEIIGQGSEAVLTELSDAELLAAVTLDIHRALGEN